MEEVPLVFISEPIHPAGLQMLTGKFRVIVAPDTSRKTTIDLIRDADAVILRSATVFDRETIYEAKRLKIISRTGVGLNNVDINAANELGIYVCNARNANTVSVAEHTLTMILCLAKQVFMMDKAARGQEWAARYSLRQMEISGKTIGLIGFGSIGKTTAKLCISTGMKVIAWKPNGKIDVPGVVQTNNIEQIFTDSDFVSIHCPFTKSNYHMVSRKLIGLMKPLSYLINTSRGELVDELALANALNENSIAGAAIDVFEQEPISIKNPLTSARNIILSPHVAGSTNESDERVATIAAQAVLDTLSGKKPSNIVNDQL